VIDGRKLVELAAGLVLSTTVLVIILNRILPTQEGLVGQDFTYFMPYLLAGKQWIALNGWSSIPYFTPDFCGGMPWLANPQSLFYSVPQILSEVTDFVTAIKITAIMFSIIGAISTYAILQECFKTSSQAAVLGAIIFQLNGFLIFRIGAGHLTYHVFGLVPAIALCVLFASEKKLDGTVNYFVRMGLSIVLVGLLFAIIIYGGAPNYIMPTVLTVAAVVLSRQITTGWNWTPWISLAGGFIWGIALSALKLGEAFVFVSDYPRAYLERLLFSNPWTMISYLFRGLFVPEMLPPLIVMSKGNLLQHEFEFGMSVVPAFLIIAALLLHPKRIGLPKHPLIILLLTSIIAIPLVATVGSEAWGRFLESIPIINNNTVLTRLYSIYILPIIVLTAISFDQFSARYQKQLGSSSADLTLGICILLASLQLLSRDLSYYIKTPLYDPAPILAEANRISSGALLTPITPISEIGPAPAAGPISIMNAFLSGRSALPCYEPLFGYGLEMFPARQLRRGPITSRITDDLINIADPRCYLTEKQRSCVPGSLFRTRDMSDALEFASHRPLRWKKPLWQKLAELTTAGSFTVSAVLLGLVAAGRLAKAWKQRRHAIMGQAEV
jgi:hypothetical protein